MKRLIVNADDFRLCPGIDEGVVELAARGIVTTFRCSPISCVP